MLSAFTVPKTVSRYSELLGDMKGCAPANVLSHHKMEVGGASKMLSEAKQTSVRK